MRSNPGEGRSAPDGPENPHPDRILRCDPTSPDGEAIGCNNRTCISHKRNRFRAFKDLPQFEQRFFEDGIGRGRAEAQPNAERSAVDLLQRAGRRDGDAGLCRLRHQRDQRAAGGMGSQR